MPAWPEFATVLSRVYRLCNISPASKFGSAPTPYHCDTETLYVPQALRNPCGFFTCPPFHLECSFPKSSLSSFLILLRPFFKYSLHLFGLLKIYLGPKQTSEPGVEGTCVPCYFQIISPFPSCKSLFF